MLRTDCSEPAARSEAELHGQAPPMPQRDNYAYQIQVNRSGVVLGKPPLEIHLGLLSWLRVVGLSASFQ